MKSSSQLRVARRRLLLGVPAVVATAALAPRAAQAAPRRPKVLECAADLFQAS